MARRTPSESDAVTDEQVTDAAEVTDTDAAEVTEQTTEPTPDTEPEAPVDLTDFKAKVDEALAEADTTTGDVPEASIASVNAAYRDLEGTKAKREARDFLDEAMKAAIVGKDINKAKGYVLIKDKLSAGSGGSGASRTPADPTNAFVARVVALRLAYNEVTSNVPDGVSDDWAEKAEALAGESADAMDAYRAFQASEDDDAEEPEVSAVVRSAFKLAKGRASGGGGSTRAPGAPRRETDKHVEQVFAELESGAFLTINEIAKAPSEEYGDDRPSAGAISQRLFPKGKDAYESDTVRAVAEDGKARGAVRK